MEKIETAQQILQREVQALGPPDYAALPLRSTVGVRPLPGVWLAAIPLAAALVLAVLWFWPSAAPAMSELTEEGTYWMTDLFGEEELSDEEWLLAQN